MAWRDSVHPRRALVPVRRKYPEQVSHRLPLVRFSSTTVRTEYCLINIVTVRLLKLGPPRQWRPIRRQNWNNRIQPEVAQTNQHKPVVIGCKTNLLQEKKINMLFAGSFRVSVYSKHAGSCIRYVLYSYLFSYFKRETSRKKINMLFTWLGRCVWEKTVPFALSTALGLGPYSRPPAQFFSHTDLPPGK